MLELVLPLLWFSRRRFPQLTLARRDHFGHAPGRQRPGFECTRFSSAQVRPSPRRTPRSLIALINRYLTNAIHGMPMINNAPRKMTPKIAPIRQ
jgi:hypothetical protein